MLMRNMADSEREDRRPEQLAECCYGLACIDALARRKAAPRHLSSAAGVVVSAQGRCFLGSCTGQRSHQTARHKPPPRSSSSCRCNNSNVNTSRLHFAEIVWRHLLSSLRLRHLPPTGASVDPTAAARRASPGASLILSACTIIDAV